MIDEGIAIVLHDRINGRTARSNPTDSNDVWCGYRCARTG